MSQTTLLIVVAAILTGGILLYNTQRHANAADERLEEQQFKTFARDAAEAGLNVVVRALAESPDMGSWSDGGFDIAATSYNGGTFMADVQQHNASGDTVNVTVRGWHGAGRAVIFARYARDEDDVGIPPSFRNVITTQLNIDVDGRLLVDAISDDWNASIHTNTILTTDGSSFRVEGYGTYWNNGLPLVFNDGEMEGFAPNIDYNSPECPVPPGDCGFDNNVFQTEEPIEIPPIDAQALFDAADAMGTVIPGTLTATNAVIDFTDPAAVFWGNNGMTYTCQSPCGTVDNPGILYVSGASSFSGFTDVRGFGIIFVDAPITISGSMYGAISPGSQTQVLLATTSNIDAQASLCLGRGPQRYRTGGTWVNNACRSFDDVTYTHGISLYAENQVDFSGNPFIIGGIVSPNARFNGNGNPWIAYAAPSETIIDPGFEYVVPIGPVLLSYSEW